MTSKPSEGTERRSRTLAAVLALILLPLAFAPRAEGFIYWTNHDAIGRTTLDGAHSDGWFISGLDPAEWAEDIAVDGRHIYWAAEAYPGGKIGRAKLDGTGVKPAFIRTATTTYNIAVGAKHLYWTWDLWDYELTGAHVRSGIGRANLDGTGVDDDFIDVVSGAFSIAVNAKHIYWTRSDYWNPGHDSIGRANLDGTDVRPAFITGVDGGDLAVDAKHIYWAYGGDDYGSPGSLGRARLDGTGVEQHFIPGDYFSAVAVDRRYIYWRGEGPREGRANLDGTGIDRSFFRNSYVGGDLAVDARTDTRAAGKCRAARIQPQGGKRIVVKATVETRERLTAMARGKIKLDRRYELKPKKISLGRNDTWALKLKPEKTQAKKIAAALKRGKTATAKLKVTLVDWAANRETKTLRVRLR